MRISDIALIIAWNLVRFISITDLEASPCADNHNQIDAVCGGDSIPVIALTVSIVLG